ncbi:MAG: 4a-hydroxytetrahydrobiopterin dehydratase [Candidatus Omnitrophota bacterium]
MNKSEAAVQLTAIPGWQMTDTGNGIFRLFVMKNFIAAVQFIQAIADLAEKDNHHPDVHLTGYRNLRVELSTHKIGGLSENDFILAAKINTLQVDLKRDK